MKILLCCFMISCASVKMHTSRYTIFPGEVKKMTLSLPLREDQTLYCDGKKMTVYPENDMAVVYLSESYFSKRTSYKCFYKRERETNPDPVAFVTVKKKEYPKEFLKVNKKMVSLSPKNIERVIREKKILGRIYSKSSKDPLFEDQFEKPLSSKITSFYGMRRIFNNKKKTQHLGTDFRAPVGVKIPVSNSGRVVLAKDLFFSGKTVVVDHGMGIFTMYGHLSKLKVKEGMNLSKKDLVGLAGSTGRATGPHLHWGVKVHGNWIDGLSLIRESGN